MSTPTQPIKIAILAMGGEGGGVLADWIVAAATAAGLPVQSTSIPGVAQRTGATTYYLEIAPAPAPGAPRPPMPLRWRRHSNMARAIWPMPRGEAPKDAVWLGTVQLCT